MDLQLVVAMAQHTFFVAEVGKFEEVITLALALANRSNKCEWNDIVQRYLGDSVYKSEFRTCVSKNLL